MIYESYVWKQELKKELDKFTRQILKSDSLVTVDNRDQTYFKIEKFFFISSFIIRKLNEAHKLSDELNETQISIEKSMRINKDIELGHWNNHHVDEFYKLNQFQASSISVSTLCNSIIHSFIFGFVFNSEEESDFDKEKDFIGVIVNSDFSKEKYLYYVKIEEFVFMVKEVIKDDIVHSISIRNGKNIKEIRSRVSRPIPNDWYKFFPNSPHLEK